jgi:hypothetical protein
MFSAKYKNKLWKTTFKTTILCQQMNRSGLLGIAFRIALLGTTLEEVTH